MMRGTHDQPNSRYSHVYAIVRFDLDLSAENATVVVKVVPSQELAEKEVERLNEANKGKRCVYRVQTTKFVEHPETGWHKADD